MLIEVLFSFELCSFVVLNLLYFPPLNLLLEWKFNRFAFLNQFSTSDVLPSPFNILSQGINLVGEWWRGGGRKRKEEGEGGGVGLYDAGLKLKRKRDQVYLFYFIKYFMIFFFGI